MNLTLMNPTHMGPIHMGPIHISPICVDPKHTVHIQSNPTPTDSVAIDPHIWTPQP
jgi:hypothetical protein